MASESLDDESTSSLLELDINTQHIVFNSPIGGKTNGEFQQGFTGLQRQHTLYQVNLVLIYGKFLLELSIVANFIPEICGHTEDLQVHTMATIMVAVQITIHGLLILF